MAKMHFSLALAVVLLMSAPIARAAEFVGSDSVDDVFNGGDEDDTMQGFGGNDTLNGHGGNDSLHGGPGNDTMSGGAGDDDLRGGPGSNTMSGGPGDDTLWGGDGVDSYAGGAGVDRVSFFFKNATQGVVASLATQTIANDGFGNSETMSGIESLGGATRFADSFTGNSADNFFAGGGSGDTLLGAGGNDTFQIDDAPALIHGGPRIDRISWFTQRRLVDANSDGITDEETTTNGVVVDLSQRLIHDDGWGGSGQIIAIEHLNGSNGNDTLTGNAQANELSGLLGDDTIFGRNGDDILTGGPGADVLHGGGGADTFVYSSLNDSPPSGRDTIQHFRRADNDKIKIDQAALLAAFMANGGLGTNFNVQVAVLAPNGNTSRLLVDIDGGGPELEILVRHGGVAIDPAIDIIP